MKIATPTFGSDFEVFCQEIKSKKIVPVQETEIDGTKDRPVPIGEGCYSQMDNALCEYNIPPVASLEDWNKYLTFAFEKGNEILAKTGHEHVIQSSHMFQSQVLDYYNLRELGCASSWSAYHGNPVKPNGRGDLRTSGFHLHIGFEDNDNSFKFADAQYLAQLFDVFVGIPSVILDKDTERRKLYGKSGDFRLKKLQPKSENDPRIQLFEYRTLGGEMLKHNKFCYQQMQLIVEAYNNKLELDQPAKYEFCIDEGEQRFSQEVINQFNIQLPENE
jgi:hypothetical protein